MGFLIPVACRLPQITVQGKVAAWIVTIFTSERLQDAQ